MNAILDGLKKESLTQDLLLSLIASILLGATSSLALPLPFTPVPIVLQVQLVLAMGALLGPRRAALTLLFYLTQGLMGYPVFAMGASGLATLLGPRGGYLMGYLMGAVITGFLYERGDKSRLDLFKSMALGNIVVYLMGWLWLSQFLGAGRALLCGVLPFIVTDLLKLLLVARFFPKKA